MCPALRAKAKNHKGFQRDWWDRATSVLLCFYNVFATLAKNASHGSIKNSRDQLEPYWKILGSRSVHRKVRAHLPPQMTSFSDSSAPRLPESDLRWGWGWAPTHQSHQSSPGPEISGIPRSTLVENVGFLQNKSAGASCRPVAWCQNLGGALTIHQPLLRGRQRRSGGTRQPQRCYRI